MTSLGFRLDSPNFSWRLGPKVALGEVFSFASRAWVFTSFSFPFPSWLFSKMDHLHFVESLCRECYSLCRREIFSSQDTHSKERGRRRVKRTPPWSSSFIYRVLTNLVHLCEIMVDYLHLFLLPTMLDRSVFSLQRTDLKWSCYYKQRLSIPTKSRLASLDNLRACLITPDPTRDIFLSLKMTGNISTRQQSEYFKLF